MLPSCYSTWYDTRDNRRKAILYDIAIIFFGTFIEAFPFLVIGVLVSSLITVFVSAETIAKLFPRKGPYGLLAGLLAGFVFPVCECGNIPVARSLLAKDVGPGPVITFLLAAPVFNPIAIVGTAVAFPGRPWIPWMRVLLTAVVAFATGLFFMRKRKEDMCRSEFLRACRADDESAGDDGERPGNRENPGVGGRDAVPGETGEEPSHGAKSGKTGGRFRDRLLEALILALDEFFYVARFLAAGALIAALVRTVLPQQWILNLGKGPVLSVLAMIVLAFVVSMCSNVDAFFAAVFTDTFSSSSILAFLVFGPMIDIKAVSMLYSTFNTKAILMLVSIVFGLTFVPCLLVNLL